jgi:hypothetical protein
MTYVTGAVDQAFMGLEVGQVEGDAALGVAAAEAKLVPDLHGTC